MKICVLEKTAPQYISNSLNCKNQEHRNIAPLSLQLRSFKKAQKSFLEKFLYKNGSKDAPVQNIQKVILSISEHQR